MKSFLRTFFSRGIIIKISVVIAFVFIAGAVFAPVIGRYDPNAIELNNALKASGNGHIFGTDAYGRDVFTRLLYGARISLLASVFSCLAAAIIGMLLGLLAGYYEKAAALIIMRYVDIQLSIPPLLFTIVIGLVAGHGLGGLIFAISFGLIPGFTRLMYGIVLSIKESDYIVALRLADIKSYKIILKHLLPNSFPSMIVMFATNLGSAIMLESTLSFLGIGIQMPTASWGNMVSDGYSYLFTNPMLALLPGVCITLIVVAFNIIGDGLRDALDPRLRGKL
ncbi:ABC transporter permease [Hungatella hathewayi]|uniref:ABC transporter permease n=1 Tax=Hungatella hathewayi TaxID=154046 RepID=A0A374P6K6_9FIRM|nr:ABC transporter permease [Hungatella sp. L36]MBS5242755.1 ABC transporter permease [Hungatella hathewayi]RGJ01652.1 ABC transporter permease [Hungatella hathewayi]RGK97625.1 ABC transporter permease [Hungatella hathewayi]RGO73939.1 ABC transporter permease [Hungatella hathewayi]